MREKLLTLVFMAALAAVFTAGVSAVHLATRERVRLNRELAEKRVVMKVLGIRAPEGSGLQELDRLYEGRVGDSGYALETEGGLFPIFAGYSEAGALQGYAFQIAGRGFWDTVRGFVAVSPDRERILGVSFFEQNETPGLGAEITQEWFERQFEGKQIPSEAGPDGRLIRLLPPGSAKGPPDVDAITGATGTSTAVERLLNEGLSGFLTVMRSEPQMSSGTGQKAGN